MVAWDVTWNYVELRLANYQKSPLVARGPVLSLGS